MIPILSSLEAFDLDKSTIEFAYTSEELLMDSAGRLSAQFIVERIDNPFNTKFVIFAGPGNNGGDGIICHYYLSQYGIQSKLFILDQNMIDDRIFIDYSISKESILEEKVEESVVNGLANGLTTIFVDNPKLMDFLKEKIKEG